MGNFYKAKEGGVRVSVEPEQLSLLETEKPIMGKIPHLLKNGDNRE